MSMLTPLITWNALSDITFNTALSNTQLDATATDPITGDPVTGTFDYSPYYIGEILTVDTYDLTVLFTPDITGYTTANGTNTLTVVPQTPQILWYPVSNTNTFKPLYGGGTSGNATIYYGRLLTSSQLNAYAHDTILNQTISGGTWNYLPHYIGEELSAGVYNPIVYYTPDDNVDYTTASGTCTITVLQSTPIITWNPITSNIPYNTPLDATMLNATALAPITNIDLTSLGHFDYSYTDNHNVVHSIAINDILPVGNYTLNVLFTPNDTQNYTTGTTSASLYVSESTETVTWGSISSIIYGTPLSDTQLNATVIDIVSNQEIPGTFSYTDQYGNPITGGTILSAGTQTLNVSFVPDDTVDYPSITGVNTITVLQQTPNVVWVTFNITYGTSIGTLEEAVDATDIFTFNSVEGTLACDQINTTLNAGQNQILTGTFYPTDTTDYATVTGLTAIINVAQVTPVITWGIFTSPITYNDTISLHNDLTAFAADTINGIDLTGVGTFTYTYINLNNELITLANDGTDVISAGTYNSLTVLFTPNDTINYNNAILSNSLTVLQQTPNLTWSPTTNNNPLDGSVLDAISADVYTIQPVNGSFAYYDSNNNPISTGITLDSGTHTLSVIFTPSDTVDYTSATTTTSITISQITPVITWNPISPITYGQPLSNSGCNTQLTATATDPTTSQPVSGTFVYTYTDSGNNTYSLPNGTKLGVGSYTLNVTFTPDSSNYTIVIASNSVTVNLETPYLQINGESVILYLTQINSSYYNVTSSIPGNFTSDQDGASPNAGTQLMNITFTPNDNVNYGIATIQNYVVISPILSNCTVTPIDPWTYNTPISVTNFTTNSNGVSGTSVLFGDPVTLNPGLNTVYFNFVSSNPDYLSISDWSISTTVNVSENSTSIDNPTSPLNITTVTVSDKNSWSYDTPLSVSNFVYSTNNSNGTLILAGDPLTLDPGANTVYFNYMSNDPTFASIDNWSITASVYVQNSDNTDNTDPINNPAPAPLNVPTCTVNPIDPWLYNTPLSISNFTTNSYGVSGTSVLFGDPVTLNSGLNTVHFNFMSSDPTYASIDDWSITTTVNVSFQPTNNTPSYSGSIYSNIHMESSNYCIWYTNSINKFEF